MKLVSMKQTLILSLAVVLGLGAVVGAQQGIGAYARFRRQASSPEAAQPGFVNVYVRDSDGKVCAIDESSSVVCNTGGTGTVTSVDCQTGLTCTPDPIVGAGTIAMANTAVAAGSYGSATAAGAFTVDAQGRLTSASSVSITGLAQSTVTNLVSDLAAKALAATTITAGTGLSGGGSLASNRTITLADTAVTPAAYTNANITVDQQGRITAAANGSGGGGTTQTIDVINATAATGKQITSAVADSGTNIGTIINQSTSMTTRRVLDIQNAGTGLVAVRGNGTVIMELGSGQAMCAPAGTNCYNYYDSILLVSGVGMRPNGAGVINGSPGSQAWAEVGSRIFSTDIPSTPGISSNVLAPVRYLTYVGAGLIKTITPPTFGFNGQIVLIPTAAFTYDNTGNITPPTGSAQTAIVGQPMTATYDANLAKWYMSY